MLVVSFGSGTVCQTLTSNSTKASHNSCNLILSWTPQQITKTAYIWVLRDKAVPSYWQSRALKIETAQHLEVSNKVSKKKLKTHIWKTVCNCAIFKWPIGLFEGADGVELSSDVEDGEAEPDRSIHRPITLLISVPAGNTGYRVRL